MNEEEKYAKLQNLFTPAIDFLRRFQNILVVTHIDADGLSAGAILTKMLLNMKKKFTVRAIMQLDDKFINSIPDHYDVILADFGSAKIEKLGEKLNNFIVLDHHELPEKFTTPKNVAHVNPHLIGIDGGVEISASGLAYMLAELIDERNVELLPLAIVGALGDMQDVGKNHEFIGVNKVLIEKGKKLGLIEMVKDLRLFGRETKPIHIALAYSLPPTFRGLANDERTTREFLVKNCGIDIGPEGMEKTPAQLSEAEKQKIFQELLSLALDSSFPQDMVEDLYGYVYLFPKFSEHVYLKNAIEFANILNACGKMEKPGLGIAVALGAIEYITNALIEVARYRANISLMVNKIYNEKRIVEYSNIYVVHLHNEANEGITSTIATILVRSLTKPLIVLVYSKDGHTKVSARAPRNINVNMGIIMRKASEAVGGLGGGHMLAAGALIPTSKEKKFIEVTNTLVKEFVEGCYESSD